MTAKKRIPLILVELERLYPETVTALQYGDPFQLAVATILSAQCTDARVNLVTPALFARFPDAKAFAAAKLPDIEKLIHSTGFFRNKAKSIQGFAEAIINQHHGEVPRTLDELVQLPGIGRKTANVVLGEAFGIPGVTVDTHVGRLARRLGFTTHTDAVKVEFVLQKLIPQPDWTKASHRLIFHGRQICHSRKPRCGDCTLAPLCPSRTTPNPEPPGT